MSTEHKSTSLLGFAGRRLLHAIPLVFVIIVVNFLLIHAAPGDPVTILVGKLDTPDPRFVEAMKARFGLDRPLPEQLLLYIVNLLQGDLGRSTYYNQPVLSVILSRSAATILLMGTSVLIASVLGILMGVIAARKPRSAIDNFLTSTSLLAYSVPNFYLAMVLTLVFGVTLGWFPVQGMVSVREELTGFDYVISLLSHMALPLTTLSLSTLATIVRLTRAGMLEQIGQDYITMARAKGLNFNQVLWKHALRNALLPVITYIGLLSGSILAGAVLIEIIFAWPGLGLLLLQAVLARDYPLLLGLIFFLSVAVIAANLVTDIIYAFLDPRIRYR